MEQRVAKLEVEVLGLRRDVDAHTTEFRSIRESLAELVKQVSALSAKVDKLDWRIEALASRFDSVPTKLQMALWGLSGLAVLLGGMVTLCIVLLRMAGYSALADAFHAVKP
jgi:chaperonin cofactor prefoldin